MRPRPSLLYTLLVAGCAGEPDGARPEPIPGCPTCAPGSVAGGTFFPADPGTEQTLRATPGGLPIRALHDELFLLDGELNVTDEWRLQATSRLVVDHAFDDTLAAVAVSTRSRETSGAPPYERQSLLESFASDGTLRWTVELTPWTSSGEGFSRVALVGDQVLVGGPGEIAAFSLADGALRWTVDAAPTFAAGGARIAAIESPPFDPPTLSVFDVSGTPVWSLTTPLATEARFHAVDVDDAGRTAIAGTRTRTLDLGDGVVLDGHGGFVVVFEPDGSIAWAADSWRAPDYELAGTTSAIMLTADGVALVGESGLNSSEGLTIWMDASGVRWSAKARANAGVRGAGVLVRDGRVDSAFTMSGPFDDLDPNTEDVTTTTLGETTLTGSGTAFVSFVR